MFDVSCLQPTEEGCGINGTKCPNEKGCRSAPKKIGKFYTRHPVFCKFTWASDVQTSSVAEFVGTGCVQRFDTIMPT